jgi:ketosteroid isomerase-like protein
MSQANVEAFERGLEAGNRGDVDTLLEVLDTEAAWHSALHALLGGEATLYRGHDGIREMLRDLYDAFDEIRIEVSEIRDMGDGKAISVRGYLDPKETLEAAGLRE